MKRVLAVGCSFFDKRCKSYVGTQVDFWPKILAEEFNCDITILGQSGCGNRSIHDRIIDHGDGFDFIIAQWTQFWREDWVNCNANWGVDDTNNVYATNSTYENVYGQLLWETNYFNPPAVIDRNIRWINTIRKAYPNSFHLFGPRPIDSHIVQHFSIPKKFILKSVNQRSRIEYCVNNILREKGEEYFIAPNDGHPGQLGQDYIADLLYGEMSKCLT
jgi:hypothetical protein